ncbi:MAG TPA: nitroreductase family protein [Acidimicrobiales bacterium]|nr:nitroreductase family protein [Acidimicrobiales bacterium]
MEFQDVVRRRRMVRNYQDRPLPPGALDRILDNARRAPSAGFTQGWAFLALEGREQTEIFWSHTFDPERRASFAHQGLFNAPALVVPLVSRQAHLDRYGEPDKATTGLADEEAWPVPYWDIDGAFATMLMLLTAVDAELGALFFGIFSGQSELLSALGVPKEYRPIGALAIGHPAPGEKPSKSARRGRRGLEEVVHRGHW